MKRIISFLLILFIGTFSITLFAFQNEPDGFRGIKWGTKIENLNDMKFLGKALNKDRTLYTTDNDKLQIGGAKLKRIIYFFWKGKFSGVFIRAKGIENWEALKQAVFAKFGESWQENQPYIWLGTPPEGTNMLLSYNEDSENISFTMYSVRLEKEQHEAEKQKAKEGTNDF
jgi:hypothetical protein